MTYTHTDGTTRTVTVKRQTYDGSTFRIEYVESVGTFSGPLRAASIDGDLAEAFWDGYNSDEALDPMVEYAVGVLTRNEFRDLFDLDPIEIPSTSLPPGL